VTESAKRIVSIWLYIVSFFIATLVVFGGFVRLTRSGLSIVEWNVITGVLPPIGETVWQQEFLKYQATPEFKIVNTNMTLDEYKKIYYIEHTHRLWGRFAGLVYAVPLMVFLLKGVIPIRRSLPYLGMGLLLGFQGFLGWFMVQSGLIDKPRVNPVRLSAHLIVALSLLALCFLSALRNARDRSSIVFPLGTNNLRGMSLGLLIIVLVQIAYGGFVAGLKAGYVSNTFPLMSGRLIPPGLFTVQQPWFINLFATAQTVHFIHRWLAFVVLIYALGMYYIARRGESTQIVLKSLQLIISIVIIQIAFGIGVVLFSVPISLALIHQATGMLLFLVVVILNYRLWFASGERTQPDSASLQAGSIRASSTS
jgi:cytochrome c oxidase assembly protein subunit 15